MNNSVLGFNGERLDPISGSTHLGNGYRVYKPILMRFNCLDSLSPFSAGGINPYAYCADDPMNQADPSGHLSWQAWTGLGMGVLGLGLTIFTAGASIAATGGVMAALESASAGSLTVGMVGVVSDVTAIASGYMEDSYPEPSAALGWVSLAAGTLGVVQGIYSARKAISRGLKKFCGSSCVPISRTSVHEIPLANNQSAQIQRLIHLNKERRLFPRRESMATMYQEIASSNEVYRLGQNPKDLSKYIMTDLGETHGRYPDGDYIYVIRADSKNDVLLGKTPDIPEHAPGFSEIAGHTSMTRDSVDTDPVDVYYAGEIRFRQGCLIRWNNASGHYKPSSLWASRNMEPFVRQLLPMSKFEPVTEYI